jgi:DNA-directed RNA polymerase specialized sigma24 family protein
MDSMQADRLKGLLYALDKTQRMVLLLFYVDELTKLEISIVLEMSESRIDQIINSVRDRARQAIAKTQILQSVASN